MKWKKSKQWVITKSHFYSQRQMIQSSETLKNLTIFLLDCLSHTNRLKFHKQDCWNWNICTVCARKLFTNKALWWIKMMHISIALCFQGPETKITKRKICRRSIWFSSYLNWPCVLAIYMKFANRYSKENPKTLWMSVMMTKHM